MFNLEYYSPWLVWLFPIASSLIVPLVAKFNSKARDSFVIVSGIITLILAMSMIPGVYPAGTESTSSMEWIPIVGVNLGVFLDPLSVLFTNLIAFIGLIVLIYSLSYMAHEEGLTRYYFLMLFFIGSMNGLVIADNFFQMFIFWELVGLCSYALVSFWYKHPEAVRASIKVFLMTKIGDIALLAGILLVYANLHVLSYKQVFEQYGTIAMPMLTLISMLMLLGAVVKSAQLPLHTWLYSAMEAPTSVSCLLHGATMVKGGVYLIARTLVMFSSIPVWLTSVAWIGALTALIGATLALHTPDVKGVPAYSTISQIGFMIAALGAAPSPQSLGWFASLFHMISHAFFQGLGFLTIGGIVHQVGTRDMRKMGGLMKSMPITFVFSIIVILSRSGIPPFSSFFSKGLIASSLLATGNIPLIFLIYSSAAITFAYSYRFLVLTFAGEKSEYVKGIKVHEAPRLMCVSSGVLAAGCIVLGFLGEPIVSFLGTNFTFDLTKFFSLESSVFIIVLFVGGFPTYLAYQRKTISIEKLRKGTLRFLDTALENGYFFDTIYGDVSNCFTRVSNGLHDIIEMRIMERIPALVATGVTKLASITLENFDATLDKLTYIVAQATAFHSLKIKRIHSGGLPHFVLAAVLGFFFLCILLLLTM